MKSSNCGNCLIFNNAIFNVEGDDIVLGNRYGSEADQNNLESVFTWLGFECTVARDSTAKQLECFLNAFSVGDHSQYDMFVCCIMSHGFKGGVYSADGKRIYLESIVETFKWCKSLLDKPKVFIVQACQDEDVSFEFPPDETCFATRASEINQVSSDGDFLVILATTPGTSAWRTEKQGSWFILELCDNLKRFAHERDMLEIFTKVNNNMKMRKLALRSPEGQKVSQFCNI